MTAVLYTDTGIVDAGYKFSTCIHPSCFDACDVSCDVIYYVIVVRARRMVRISFLPYLGNRSKSDPRSYELFCLESHILSFPRVLQIPPESPCILPTCHILYTYNFYFRVIPCQVNQIFSTFEPDPLGFFSNLARHMYHRR